MPPNTSLIIRLPNWVGDVMMTLPALRALQSVGFNLELIGKHWASDLLQAFPANIHTLPNTILATQQLLRTIHAKKALLFTNSLSSALMMRFAQKSTVGYSGNLRSILLTYSPPKPTNLHEVETFWNISRIAASIWRPLDAWPNTIPAQLDLPISEKSQRIVNDRLKQHQIAAPFIVLCPFATGLTKEGHSKIWPHWAELSKKLHKKGVQSLVSPAPSETPRCQELVPHAIVLPGLRLNELGALFQQADLVVANDSGPMHIAAGVNTPVLGLFGETDPNRTYPWGGNYLGTQGKWPSVDQVFKQILDI